MKSKTESKRQAILAVAAQAFRELGFRDASMSEICARVGGSKATLYNYFDSKEALFLEVMFQSSEHEFATVLDLLDPGKERVEEALRCFGRGFLHFIYSPAVSSARRLMIAECGRQDLGRLCYARGPQKADALLSEFLARAMAGGQLRAADPHVSACHLRGLLESELLDRFMFGVTSEFSTAEIDQVVDRAVDVFLAAYGMPLPSPH